MCKRCIISSALLIEILCIPPFDCQKGTGAYPSMHQVDGWDAPLTGLQPGSSCGRKLSWEKLGSWGSNSDLYNYFIIIALYLSLGLDLISIGPLRAYCSHRNTPLNFFWAAPLCRSYLLLEIRSSFYTGCPDWRNRCRSIPQPQDPSLRWLVNSVNMN